MTLVLFVLLDLLMLAGAVVLLIHRSLKITVVVFAAVNSVAALAFALLRAEEAALAQFAFGVVLTPLLFMRSIPGDAAAHEK